MSTIIAKHTLLSLFIELRIICVCYAIKLQVYHYCHFDGRQDSFLCPAQTAFNQKVFVCDWWHKVNCAVAKHFYALNQNLYTVSILGNINFLLCCEFLFFRWYVNLCKLQIEMGLHKNAFYAIMNDFQNKFWRFKM